MTSPAFVDGGPLDARFTCDGADVPPPLAVTQVPLGTAELALTVTDEDADGYVHWIVAGLPPTLTTIDGGQLPAGAITVRGDAGTDGWSGPCPPTGDAAHHYDFTVYALAEALGLDAGLAARDAVAVIQQAAFASDVLTATYASPADG